jgi:hypothetical protein
MLYFKKDYMEVFYQNKKKTIDVQIIIDNKEIMLIIVIQEK